MEKNIHITGDAQELRDLFVDYPHMTQGLQLWRSPEAIASYVETLSVRKAWNAQAWANNYAFTGTGSMRRAIALARDGWPDGANRAAKLRDKINTTYPVAPRLARYAVAGAVPSIPRALAGNPMNMRQIDSARTRRRPVLTLAVNISVSAMVASNALLCRAATIAAVIDAIESTGFSLHILGTESGERNQCLSFCAYTLKEPNQPADIARLAFGLGHPSMLRRLIFACISSDHTVRELGGGLGCPAKLSGTESDRNARGLFSLDKMNSADQHLFASDEAAATIGLQSILQELIRQNCPAFPRAEAA